MCRWSWMLLNSALGTLTFWFIEGLGGLTYSHICECYPINENLVWCRVSSRCLRYS